MLMNFVFHPERYHMVVNRSEKAIILLSLFLGDFLKNKIIKILKKNKKSDAEIKTQIRPDSWFWTNGSQKHDQIPDLIRKFHLEKC
jgi:hypothetical protein